MFNDHVKIEASFHRGDKICLGYHHVEEVQDYQEGVFKTWCYVSNSPCIKMMMERRNTSSAKYLMIGGGTKLNTLSHSSILFMTC